MIEKISKDPLYQGAKGWSVVRMLVVLFWWLRGNERTGCELRGRTLA